MLAAVGTIQYHRDRAAELMKSWPHGNVECTWTGIFDTIEYCVIVTVDGHVPEAIARLKPLTGVYVYVQCDGKLYEKV